MSDTDEKALFETLEFSSKTCEIPVHAESQVHSDEGPNWYMWVDCANCGFDISGRVEVICNKFKNHMLNITQIGTCNECGAKVPFHQNVRVTKI